MITTAATTRNIQLIVETIIASHVGIAFALNITLKARRRTRVSVLTSFECACAKHYPWVYCTR